jgi:hypothetical protein
MSRRLLPLLLVVFSLSLGGCIASGLMNEVPDEQRVSKPAPGKALVYFVRPSSFGGAIQASVFDGDKYIGTTSAKTHIAYQAKPGKHMFMIIAENADFMEADLRAGKTYHAIVQARMGAWKARFSFRPQNGQTSKSRLAGWVKSTRQVVVNEQGTAWARNNRPSIQKKKAKYLPKWRAKADSSKQRIHAKSGV